MSPNALNLAFRSATNARRSGWLPTEIHEYPTEGERSERTHHHKAPPTCLVYR